MAASASTSEFKSLLQSDNKGWNIALFKDYDKIHGFLCEQCNEVCCEAVELGCNHNDVDICSYCKSCLEELIKNNNGKCIIDNHQNPMIIPARSIRRQILKTVVLCPYSIAYQQKIQNDGMQLIDTINEEKEGAVIAAINDPKKDIVGCNWNGTLLELTETHLPICVNQYNPSFQINEISTQNKYLKNENMKLNMVITQQKQKISEQQDTINILTKQNGKLKHETDEYLKVINTLKQENKALLTRLNASNEDQKLNEQEKSQKNIWSQKLVHKHFKIDGDKITKTQFSDYSKMAFLDGIFSDGLHCFRFKLKEIEFDKYLKIGIWKKNVEITSERLNSWLGQHANTSYAFYAGAARVNIHDKNNKFTKKKSYGICCKENGTVVDMYVDFNNLELRFAINGKDYGKSHDIDDCEYRVAISCDQRDTQIQLLSHSYASS